MRWTLDERAIEGLRTALHRSERPVVAGGVTNVATLNLTSCRGSEVLLVVQVSPEKEDVSSVLADAEEGWIVAKASFLPSTRRATTVPLR